MGEGNLLTWMFGRMGVSRLSKVDKLWASLNFSHVANTNTKIYLWKIVFKRTKTDLAEPQCPGPVQSTSSSCAFLLLGRKCFDQHTQPHCANSTQIRTHTHTHRERNVSQIVPKHIWTLRCRDAVGLLSLSKHPQTPWNLNLHQRQSWRVISPYKRETVAHESQSFSQKQVISKRFIPQISKPGLWRRHKRGKTEWIIREKRNITNLATVSLNRVLYITLYIIYNILYIVYYTDLPLILLVSTCLTKGSNNWTYRVSWT